MHKIWKVLSSYIIIEVVLGVLLAACSTGPAPSPLVESEVRAYADPIAENILQAVNSGDYAKFSADFNDTMKKAITVDAFKTLDAQLKNTIGEYESKSFTGMQRVDKNIVTVYAARFSNEPAGVKVTVSFENVDVKPMVAGLFFSSPKLQGAK